MYQILNSIHSHNTNTNVIIQIDNVYNYPKVQFIKLLSWMYDNVLISFSRYNNSVLVLCENKINAISKCKNRYIKDFNIVVDDYIIQSFKKYNNELVHKYTLFNKCIRDTDDIYKEINLLNRYLEKFILRLYSHCECNNLYLSNSMKCFICQECYSISAVDHLLCFHAAAASFIIFL